MADTRDEGIVSPSQAWLVREIMTNSSSSINVFTARDPQLGFHLSLFASFTLDGVKVTVTVAISVVSQTGAFCGGWDRTTAKAFSQVSAK